MLVAVEIWVDSKEDSIDEESLFVHVASSYDKAIDWIKKHGDNWYDEPYKFVMYEVEVDKDEDCESFDVIFHVDVDGNIIKEENKNKPEEDDVYEN